MLKKEVAALLEQQINKEFYSAYLYLDMSNYYYSKNLDGFGNWFKIQAQEERDHAMLFLTYLQNNGECPKLGAIDAPDKVYESFRDPLAASLVHEEYVTSLINAIYAEAMKANDFRTLQFLDWFVKEQGEDASVNGCGLQVDHRRHAVGPLSSFGNEQAHPVPYR